MDLGNYLMNRTVEHLNVHNQYGKKVSKGNLESVLVLGFDIKISCDIDKIKGNKIDVYFEPEEEIKEGFKEHIKNIDTPEYWDNVKLARLKEKMKVYKRNLKNCSTEFKDGQYHFSAEIKSNNSDEIFYTVLNNVIRPVILYSLLNSK